MRVLALLALFIASGAAQEVGSQACAGCHAGIFNSYANTAMARTSGVVRAAEAAAFSFDDAQTGASYKIYPDKQALHLRVQKLEASFDTRLAWFIGSGRVGKSYLFARDHYLFQSPVSFYREASRWALSPGFEHRKTVDVTRPVEPACLQCHASQIRLDAATKNRYTPEPFLEGGIACERCHGAGAAHVASRSAKDIVHPGKLDIEAKESVCAQCHLTGAARVAKYRADGATYKPGLKLSDFSAVFEGGGGEASGLAVTSHFEKMARSRCKLAAGEELTCMSCHDPHREPVEAERASFYRDRCQACHAKKPCTGGGGNNCIACHMPKAAARGVEHAVYTDHSIPRAPGTTMKPAAPAMRLKDFWGRPAVERDMAVAFASMGRAGEALPGLEKAARSNPRDLAVLLQLAQLHDKDGRSREAEALYRAILTLEASNGVAAANLAVILVQRGDAKEAIRLWRLALKQNAAQFGIRMNIATALYRSGDRAGAAAELEEGLKYDFDQPAARKLLKELRTAVP